MKKQAASNIRQYKDKLTSHAMKFDVAPGKDRKGASVNYSKRAVKLVVLLNFQTFRLKCNRLMKKENIHLGHNADETALSWRSLTRNSQALKNEDKIPGKKISKEKSSAMLGANGSVSTASSL